MNLIFKPEQERLIKKQIQQGNFTTIDEVIDEALQLLEEKQKFLSQIKSKIAQGTEQLKHGEGIEGEMVISRLREQGKRLREKG
jgi:antitoxin ParD1/3/4